MASGWTNRGKFLMHEWVFIREASPTLPTNFFIMLLTDALDLDDGTNHYGKFLNTYQDVLDDGGSQIPDGNGYDATAGGYSLTPGSAPTNDFTVSESDTPGEDWGMIDIVDVTWSASGGPIPASGTAASAHTIATPSIPRGTSSSSS